MHIHYRIDHVQGLQVLCLLRFLELSRTLRVSVVLINCYVQATDMWSIVHSFISLMNLSNTNSTNAGQRGAFTHPSIDLASVLRA